jgi:hypothetical protein
VETRIIRSDPLQCHIRDQRTPWEISIHPSCICQRVFNREHGSKFFQGKTFKHLPITDNLITVHKQISGMTIHSHLAIHSYTPTSWTNKPVQSVTSLQYPLTPLPHEPTIVYTISDHFVFVDHCNCMSNISSLNLRHFITWLPFFSFCCISRGDRKTQSWCWFALTKHSHQKKYTHASSNKLAMVSFISF